MLPIVERELRVAARRRQGHWYRCGAAGAAVVVALLIGTSDMVPANLMGKFLFWFLAVVAAVYALLSGPFLTADSLSAERRAGTLGLLFLTDLKAYDIVLGKLAATSFNGFYALMAVIPVLGFAFIMGGVTLGELVRVSGALMLMMAWSLALGLLVSAYSYRARHLFMSTLALMLAPVLLPLLAYAAIEMLGYPSRIGEWFMLASPAAPMMLAPDEVFQKSGGFSSFILSTLWLLVFSLLLLRLTVGHLRRTALAVDPPPDRTTLEPPVPSAGRSFWRGLAYGGYLQGQGRRGLLDQRPFQWLASRNRLATILGALGTWTLLAGLTACFWILGFVDDAQGWRAVLIFAVAATTILIQLLAKFILAMESSRRLSEDRESGALELLLTTPLRPEAIWDGQRRALYRQCRFPLASATAVLLVLLMVLVGFNSMDMEPDTRWFMGSLLLGATAFLWMDAAALIWLGMLLGMRHRPHKAVWLTLFRVLGVPWLSMGLILMITAGSRGPVDGEGLFFLYLAIGLLNSWLCYQLSREHLQAHFRVLAAGDTPDPTTLYRSGSDE